MHHPNLLRLQEVVSNPCSKGGQVFIQDDDRRAEARDGRTHTLSSPSF